MNIEITEETLALLRPLFIAVEGACEAWADDEIARRVFIRGAMEYAKSAGKPWDDVMALAAELRTTLAGAAS